MADALSNMDNYHISNNLLLELVLLRLPSPACLVKAAATCKLWRRVIADSGFLRLWCSLNTPAAAFAGYYYNDVRCRGPNRGIRQSFFIPSPPLTMTPPGIHFSLDFLPDYAERYWRILDSRGSLLLMKDIRYRRSGFPDMLVVCNPLARCYRRIPTPPDHVLDGDFQLHEFYLVDGEAADDDGVGGGRVSMSNFRVLCEIHRDGITRNAVFTAGGAAGVDGDSWTDKAIETITPRLHQKRQFGRAGGRWYYLTEDDRTLISLDGHTGEYSSLVLPATEDWPEHLWNNPVYITDGRDGKPRIFSVVDGIFKVFARRLDTDSNDDGEWALEKKLVLQEATRGLPGYKPSLFNQLRLSVETWVPGSSVTLSAEPHFERWLFSVDLETMEVKTVAEADMDRRIYEYQLPWPPVLHACLD